MEPTPLPRPPAPPPAPARAAPPPPRARRARHGRDDSRPAETSDGRDANTMIPWRARPASSSPAVPGWAVASGRALSGGNDRGLAGGGGAPAAFLQPGPEHDQRAGLPRRNWPLDHDQRPVRP